MKVVIQVEIVEENFVNLKRNKMKYLVINLSPEPKIITKNGIPIIFETKQDAFRVSDKLIKGLVYPIYDVMKTLETIKLRYKHGTYGGYKRSMEDILTMLDEIL